jgi:hypothetical protein
VSGVCREFGRTDAVQAGLPPAWMVFSSRKKQFTPPSIINPSIDMKLLFLLLAASLHAQSTIQGDIKLNYLKKDESGGVLTDNAFKREFGNVVKATTSWSAGDFFGEETVSANVTVKNTGTKPMFFHYYVAFFDKDKNLVGATGQNNVRRGLKPGEETYMGSCQIGLSKDKYKAIVSYQAMIYETDIPPMKQ